MQASEQHMAAVHDLFQLGSWNWLIRCIWCPQGSKRKHWQQWRKDGRSHLKQKLANHPVCIRAWTSRTAIGTCMKAEPSKTEQRDTVLQCVTHCQFRENTPIIWKIPSQANRGKLKTLLQGATSEHYSEINMNKYTHSPDHRSVVITSIFSKIWFI